MFHSPKTLLAPFLIAVPLPPLHLDLHDATGTLPAAALTWIHSQTLAAAVVMGVSGELSVRIVDDVEMAAAHERYSGIPGTTDVLTFDLRGTNSTTPPSPPPSTAIEIDSESSKLKVRCLSDICTDIFACRDVAERESKVLGTSIERELLLYIIHGILHCIGFNDHEEADAALMHRTEDAILAAIGVGAIYKPRP